MITSRKNSHLKTIRQVRRCKDDRALLEGPHLIAEAVATGRELQSLLATRPFLESGAGRQLRARLPYRPLEVEPRLLAEVTDSDSPRGIVAVARLPRMGAADLLLAENGIFVYAEGLQDPGNLGALARATEASSAVALCLNRGSVHPNHPRALRASAGSLLRLPVATACSPAALDARLGPLVPRWVALSSHGGLDLFDVPLDGCVILALGAEGQGLSQEVRRRADVAVTIPLRPPVESLNVAVAAAVTLFELSRRRRVINAEP